MSPRKYDMKRRAAAAEETRRRIVEATLELHNLQGIRATSWEQIAARAGVGVGTVYRHFPSLGELVPACGVLTFERLALPGPGEADAMFSGLRSRRERLRRLVETLFSIYERGAGAIENARRERDDPDLSMLQEAHAHVENALDGLYAAALEPFAPTESQRREIRAFTDIPLWRSLGEQGIAGEDAVEVTVAALEGGVLGRSSGTP